MEFDVLRQVWPEWQIGKRIGGGAYGVVYEAKRNEYDIENNAAIKIISIPASESEVDTLRSEGFDMQFTRTHFQSIVNDFVNEIKIMLSLEGRDNIVSVKDYKVIEKEGEFGWYIFILMELLIPFAVYTSDHKLDEKEVIKLGCDICTALETCAEEKIIHRDIKPGNILVHKSGAFKLGDFGIARKLENMTGGLSQRYTPKYMAPEVATSRYYDERVDIYSLGIVLYELLNGRCIPFQEKKQIYSYTDIEDAVRRRKDGKEKIPAPCDASPAMADLILRACEHEPDMRFSSATEMKQALMSVANGTYQIGASNLDKTTSVRKAADSYDRTISVRKAPAASNQKSTPAVSTFGSAPKKKNKRPAVIATVLAVVLLVGVGIFVAPKLIDDNESIESEGTSGNISSEINDTTSETADYSEFEEMKTESNSQETHSTITVTQNETEPITTEDFNKTEFKLSEIDFLNSSQENGCFVEVSNQKDNVGNTYDYAMVQTDYADRYYITSDYTQYYVNKQYATFSGTLFLLEEKKTCKSEFDVTISGDGKPLYSTQVSGGFLPEYFNLDISNVDVLEIKIHNGGISNGVDTWIGIGNAVLRTSDHIETIQSTISEDTVTSTVLQSSVKISEIDFLNSSQETGCFVEVSNQKDNVGNTYDYAIIQTDYADRYYITSDYTQYYVNKQYATFSGTLFLLEEKKTCKSEFDVTISGDGKPLYSTQVSGGFLPEYFNLDISNVDVLEIKIHNGGISNGVDTWIGIGNALLLTE